MEGGGKERKIFSKNSGAKLALPLYGRRVRTVWDPGSDSSWEFY